MNYWVVRDYYRLVNSVNAFEPQIQALSDEQLAGKTSEFRRRLARGATLADIQAGSLLLYAVASLLDLSLNCVYDWIVINVSEAFAVVREAAWRKLRMRHFDVQVSFYHWLACVYLLCCAFLHVTEWWVLLMLDYWWGSAAWWVHCWDENRGG